MRNAVIAIMEAVQQAAMLADARNSDREVMRDEISMAEQRILSPDNLINIVYLFNNISIASLYP